MNQKITDMPFLNWDESFSMNISLIDLQHKKMIEMINRFYDSLERNTPQVNLQPLIRDMRSYILLHFNTEEKLFIKYNYPNTEKHNAEHKAFMKKVEELEQKCRDNKFIVSFEVTNFLRKWVKEHILESDKAYSKFLTDRGVK